MPLLPYLDPLFINFLIKKEEKDKKDEDSSEFTQIPLVLPSRRPLKPKIKPNIDENDENEGVIIIDL